MLHLGIRTATTSIPVLQGWGSHLESKTVSENQVLQNLIVDHHFPYEIAINWDIPHFLTKRHASSCKMST
jgi:hypothetical protein